MICSTVLRRLSEANGSWKTICIFRRSSRSSRVDVANTSRPSKTTRPAVG